MREFDMDRLDFVDLAVGGEVRRPVAVRPEVAGVEKLFGEASPFPLSS